MNKELLKKIIIENQEFIRKVDVMPRHVEFDKTANIVFVGPRRAGKTFAMFQIIKNMFADGMPSTAVLYVNFEDERLLEMTSRDLDLILDAWRELFGQKPVIFLDEIQVIDSWKNSPAGSPIPNTRSLSPAVMPVCSAVRSLPPSAVVL